MQNIVFIGSGFVGKTTLSRSILNDNIQNNINTYIFSSDDFRNLCSRFGEICTANLINERLEKEFNKHKNDVVIVDIGSCTLLDFKKDELEKFLQICKANNTIICHLVAFNNPQKCKKFLYDQVENLYGKFRRGVSLIKKQIDEDLNNNVYSSICDITFSILNDEDFRLMSNYFYNQKISEAKNRLLEQLATKNLQRKR